MPGSAGVLRIEDKILSGRKSGNGITGGLWEFVPQGLMDPGENFEDAIFRELREETGYLPNHLKTVPNPKFIYHSPSYGDFALAYDLDLKNEAPSPRISGEHEELVLITGENFLHLDRYQVDPVSVLIANHTEHFLKGD
jgi:8-oxo-dGTP pyrophosphatase MutT (NUDIX family)